MVFLEFQNKTAQAGQENRQPLSHNSRLKNAFTTTFDLPELNTNVSLKENCYAYSYSLKLGTHDKNDKRIFARWPVKLFDCMSFTCRFGHDWSRSPEYGKRGEICQTCQDVGAPIMCSEEEPKVDVDGHFHQKLSDMVLGPTQLSSVNEVSCRSQFYALRLGDFYREIMRALALGPPGGKKWPAFASPSWLPI